MDHWITWFKRVIPLNTNRQSTMLPLTDDVLTNAQDDINTHDLNSEFDEEYDEVNSSTFVAQMLTKKYISYFRVFFYCHNSRRFFTSGFYF